ncbi:efflux RND transporter periplasmic adaptor subunit [Pedobacter frigidisoli]|uniref:efflux RND transporter periplasmic adaptor subunit n=1 Tax=Pedobacter frigidisoli TaxID=2530455 RepID=UPI0029308052|nr:efflux RND transporter periplasmic adaptor subunit [Pedobacter frigidisoli]
MKNIVNVGLMVLAMLAACGNPDKSKDQVLTDTTLMINANEVQLSAAQMKNAGILVGRVGKKSMHDAINVNGVVDVPPEHAYSVSVPMGGYIKRMIILPGMQVKKGSVLVTVEDQQYIQLQQDYLTAKNKLKFSAADYTRQKGLNETKATSDKVFQQAEGEFNNQKVLVKSLAEKLRLIGINPITLTEDKITRTINVYAPISGSVTKVNVNAGKFVNPTDILFELISPGDLHASLNVFERDAASLKVGQEIICTSTANPDKKYTAKIHLITPNIDGDRTMSVHCDIENADSRLLPGTFLNASISVSNRSVEAVPEDAVVKWENTYYLFEDLGSRKFRLVPVEAGITMDGYTQVSSKKMPGQIVIKNAYAILMKMKNSGEE